MVLCALFRACSDYSFHTKSSLFCPFPPCPGGGDCFCRKGGYTAHSPMLMRYSAAQYRAMMGFCHVSSQWASWFFATSMSEM